MANPNIVNVQNIFGKTTTQAVTTTPTNIVSNPTGSDKVLKINTLIVSNITGTDAVDVTADVFRNSSSFKLAFTLTVPENSTLVLISKDTGIYLEENDSIRIFCSQANSLNAVCSYEDIS
jgi:hypothetical protein